LSYAKDKEVTLSSSGNGGLPHLTIELLKAASNGRIVHVAYKGAGPAITDTMAGHVDGVVMDLPALLPLIKDGRLKGLAVTGTERSTYVPELPAVAESINDFEVYNWIGLFVSSGTPADTIAYLD